MENDQVSQLMAMHGNKLPFECYEAIRRKLLSMDYNLACVCMNSFKDPTISVILSALVGAWGVDRFYIGDVGLGVGKLLSCGGVYIWWLVDIFLISDATKRKNFEIIMMY